MLCVSVLILYRVGQQTRFGGRWLLFIKSLVLARTGLIGCQPKISSCWVSDDASKSAGFPEAWRVWSWTRWDLALWLLFQLCKFWFFCLCVHCSLLKVEVFSTVGLDTTQNSSRSTFLFTARVIPVRNQTWSWSWQTRDRFLLYFRERLPSPSFSSGRDCPDFQPFGHIVVTRISPGPGSEPDCIIQVQSSVSQSQASWEHSILHLAPLWFAGFQRACFWQGSPCFCWWHHQQKRTP